MRQGTSDVDHRQNDFSPYRQFTRAEWAKLRADTPLTLTAEELDELR
ncbi:MAG TPA: type I pantothenate kinase, partial [Aestuariivirgaceae bacterium]|nr:type I pantothenate kinase [Aestuariivirgaceae bacterium]